MLDLKKRILPLLGTTLLICFLTGIALYAISYKNHEEVKSNFLIKIAGSIFFYLPLLILYTFAHKFLIKKALAYQVIIAFVITLVTLFLIFRNTYMTKFDGYFYLKVSIILILGSLFPFFYRKLLKNTWI